jgi:hypothetical protein
MTIGIVMQWGLLYLKEARGQGSRRVAPSNMPGMTRLTLQRQEETANISA